MPEMKELFQSADWKKEKHVPAIDCPDKAKKGEPVKVAVCVGKEIPHPNTTEHHIRWIGLYFLPDGEKFAYEIGRFEFAAHGESAQGPNTSTVFTGAEATCSMKTEKTGMLLASSYCNVHGLWQASKRLDVV